MVAPHQLYHMSHTLFLALCTAFADEIFVGLSLARYALNSLSCTDFDLLLALSYPYLVFSIHMHAQFFSFISLHSSFHYVHAFYYWLNFFVLFGRSRLLAFVSYLFSRGCFLLFHAFACITSWSMYMMS